MMHHLVAATLALVVGLCSADFVPPSEMMYAQVSSGEKKSGIDFNDLPGFTRSVNAIDHAIFTPESRVYAGLFGWNNTPGAYLISPGITGRAHFIMYLAEMGPASASAAPLAGVERFAFVIKGQVQVTGEGGALLTLGANDFAFFPADFPHSITSTVGAELVLFERKYAHLEGGKKQPKFVHGNTDAQPLIPVDPEIFDLRKLLPQSDEYDFNVHIMDFAPGEYLVVKENHYNQHGLLLLEGQGIYRLSDKWYPVQTGDVIWMAPWVTQWYAALGTKRSRYILYKDTYRDPLLLY